MRRCALYLPTIIALAFRDTHGNTCSVWHWELPASYSTPPNLVSNAFIQTSKSVKPLTFDLQVRCWRPNNVFSHLHVSSQSIVAIILILSTGVCSRVPDVDMPIAFAPVRGTLSAVVLVPEILLEVGAVDDLALVELANGGGEGQRRVVGAISSSCVASTTIVGDCVGGRIVVWPAVEGVFDIADCGRSYSRGEAGRKGHGDSVRLLHVGSLD